MITKGSYWMHCFQIIHFICVGSNVNNSWTLFSALGNNCNFDNVQSNVRSFWCKYVDRSQWHYFTKGLWVIFNPFSLFHMKEIFNEIFRNLLLKVRIVAPIDHMFCVNHYRINMKISKFVNFARFYVSFKNFIIFFNHTKIC